MQGRTHAVNVANAARKRMLDFFLWAVTSEKLEFLLGMVGALTAVGVLITGGIDVDLLSDTVTIIMVMVFAALVLLYFAKGYYNDLLGMMDGQYYYVYAVIWAGLGVGLVVLRNQVIAGY